MTTEAAGKLDNGFNEENIEHVTRALDHEMAKNAKLREQVLEMREVVARFVNWCPPIHLVSVPDRKGYVKCVRDMQEVLAKHKE